MKALVSQKTKDVRSLALDLKSLRSLLELVERRCVEAAEIEINHTNWNLVPADKVKEQKERIRNSSILFLSITGADGVSYHGSISVLFDDPNFPPQVNQVFFNTENTFRGNMNYSPRNAITVLLDFTRPAVLDFTPTPSAATQNNSRIDVRGLDAIWVNGVYNEVDGFLSRYPSKQKWLHQYSVYDLLLWVVGLPFGFWLCWKLQPFVSSRMAIHPFVQSMAFVYAFLFSLIGLRAWFNYARWIWPLVECNTGENRAGSHRLFWGALSVSIFGTFLYDVVKRLI